MVRKIGLPIQGSGGRHSRQAHADLPEGTYEREMSKEGFFGPAAFLYHPRGRSLRAPCGPEPLISTA